MWDVCADLYNYVSTVAFDIDEWFVFGDAAAGDGIFIGDELLQLELG